MGHPHVSSFVKPNDLSQLVMRKPALEIPRPSSKTFLKAESVAVAVDVAVYIEQLDGLLGHVPYICPLHYYPLENFFVSFFSNIFSRHKFWNMSIFSALMNLLLIGIPSLHWVAPDKPSTFPDVLPGSDMPSLASIGVTSADLYTQALALLSML